MKIAVPFLTLALTAGTPVSVGHQSAPAGGGAAVVPVVDSYVTEDLEDINASIAEAVEAGEDWPADPLRIALAVVEQGPDALSERRYLSLTFEGGSGERPGAGAVTVVTDGYLDDSMRGEWCRFEMQRTEDGTWRVTEFRHAWRCYRGIAGAAGAPDPARLERFTSETCL